MTNNLRQAQRDMKALAKQVRGVRYTEALLFTYLMTGMITFSTGLNTNPNMLYERVNKEIVMAADSTRLHIKKTKKQNETISTGTRSEEAIICHTHSIQIFLKL